MPVEVGAQAKARSAAIANRIFARRFDIHSPNRPEPATASWWNSTHRSTPRVTQLSIGIGMRAQRLAGCSREVMA
jgi:hypothetical protein